MNRNSGTCSMLRSGNISNKSAMQTSTEAMLLSSMCYLTRFGARLRQNEASLYLMVLMF